MNIRFYINTPDHVWFDGPRTSISRNCRCRSRNDDGSRNDGSRNDDGQSYVSSRMHEQLLPKSYRLPSWLHELLLCAKGYVCTRLHSTVLYESTSYVKNISVCSTTSWSNQYRSIRSQSVFHEPSASTDATSATNATNATAG